MCGKASIDTHVNKRKENPQHEPCDSSPSFPPIPDISNASSDKEVSCVYNRKAKWEDEKPEQTKWMWMVSMTMMMRTVVMRSSATKQANRGRRYEKCQ